MEKREKEVHPYDLGKVDISLLKLVNYILLFFIPLLLFLLLSIWLGSQLSGFFEASPQVVSMIFMYIFSFLVFFFIIPFIRKRENIAGMRYSVFAFLMVGIGFTLPAALQGNPNLMFSLISYFAHYVFLTFMFAPEVLGIPSDISDWFARGRQLSVFFVYALIVMLYIAGFGTLYYSIYNDPYNPQAFSQSSNAVLSIGGFMYYSFGTFATLGYGDIVPVSAAARMAASIEMLMGMIVNVMFIVMLFLYLFGCQSTLVKKETIQVLPEGEEEDGIGKVREEIQDVEKREGEIEGLLKTKKADKKDEDMDELLKRIKNL